MSDQRERRTSVDKPSWQCATPGCRNTHRFGDLCASCTTNQRHQRTPKEIRGTIHPTGETRTIEGQHQTQMTDGRQTWWAVREEWAA